MLYWLIPYLVAYRASSSGEWKYGPEHVFKAEVYSNMTDPLAGITGYSDIHIDFTCRPVNSTAFQCRTESGTMDKYQTKTGSSSREKFEHFDDFGMADIIFEMKFDESGISNSRLLTTTSSYIFKMIQAIIGTMSVNFRVAGKTFGDYVFKEKSLIGVCTTNFNMRKEFLSQKEMELETTIEGYNFDLPPLGFRTDDAMIVIEKVRNLNDCEKARLLERMPYFFGDDNENTDTGRENVVTYSKSRIHLGEESFSAYTENVGKTLLPNRPTAAQLTAGEMLRVSLRSIRPAKEKLQKNETSK